MQQVLGLHELDIARFYSDNRQAHKAAEGRLRGIITNYPNFSYLDESLYRLGVALVEQEQPRKPPNISRSWCAITRRANSPRKAKSIWRS